MTISTARLYRTWNEDLRERHGERVQKVSLDAGFTCPNRDGTKAAGGCVYCNNDSFNFSPKIDLAEQLSTGIEKAKRRFGARKFIAYFQAFTNTYGSPDLLFEKYRVIYEFPEVVGISIGTRPDCVPEEALKIVERFTSTHEVWLEYGLESSNDDTLRRINRAHTFADFRDAVLRTAGRRIRIAAHIITGFPWESEEVMLQTGLDVAALPVDSIKIHNLHIVKGTALEKMHERSAFAFLTLEQYASIVARILEHLPPQMSIQRLTAECPPDLLVGPEWCNEKAKILQEVTNILVDRRSFQGKEFKKCDD
jgi:radical SAM protein (TIGR01212 family)